MKFVALFFLMTSLHAMELSEEMVAKKKEHALTTAYDIYASDEKVGLLYRKVEKWAPEYYLEDAHGQLIAKASCLEWDRFAYAFCIEGVGVLTMSEDQAGAILSSSGDLIALVEEEVLMGAKFTLIDPLDGHPLAVLKRSFLQFQDNWKLKYLDPNTPLHPLLVFALIGAYQDNELLVRRSTKGS